MILKSPVLTFIPFKNLSFKNYIYRRVYNKSWEHDCELSLKNYIPLIEFSLSWKLNRTHSK